VGLLAVRPHPDDESSATGGVLASYAAAGISTAVVTCTRGEEGEILDATLDPQIARPRLGGIREAELRAACHVLGVSEVRLLDYRDSGMAGAGANDHPHAFSNADLDEATGRLVGVLRELRPEVVLTESADGTYGHPDHVMTHRVTVRAFAAAGDPSRYPGAGPPWTPARLYAICWDPIRAQMRRESLDPGVLESAGRAWAPRPACTTMLDVTPWVERQREAIACHRTQIAPDSWWLTISADQWRRVFGTVCFAPLHPSSDMGQGAVDLLAG
jgi:LmbE family N-acetylglucosaminyl deacetylase